MKVLVIISISLALVSAEPPAYRQQNQQRRYYFARQEEETTPSVPAEAPYPPSGWKPAGPSFDLPQRQLDNSYAPSSSFGSRTPSVDQQYGVPDSQTDVKQQEQEQQQQKFDRSGSKFPTRQFQQQQQQKEQEQQRFGSLEFQARQQQQRQQFSASQNQFQQRQYLAPQTRDQAPNHQYGAPEPQEQFQPPRPDQGYGTPFFTTTEEPSTTTEVEDSTTTTGAPGTDSEVEPVNSVNELDEEGDLDEQQAEQQQPQQRGEYYVTLPDGRLQRIRYVSHQDVEAMKYFARIRAENVEPLRGPIYSYSPLQELQFAPANLRFAPNPAVTSFSSSSATSASSAAAATSTSGKLELQEEAAAAPSPPLAAVVQYAYDTPSAVIPLAAPASGYSANYRAPASEPRYLISFQ